MKSLFMKYQSSPKILSKRKTIIFKSNSIPKEVKKLILKKSQFNKLFRKTNNIFYFVYENHLYEKIRQNLKIYNSNIFHKIIEKIKRFKTFIFSHKK